ncbi:MAG TPA: hypothetical protein VJ954_02505 [Ignavibacteriaceae bacterium]|nr:hypothetical protein [Ignavibacteriaceae bacterium]
MPGNLSLRKETWNTIFIFLAIVTILSSIYYYAIVKLYPSRIYIGGLMWYHALTTILTLKLKKRPISSLNWNCGNWKYIRLFYIIPALYGLITYTLIWISGFGIIANKETIQNWAKELGLIGIGNLNSTSIVIIAVILLGTVEVIRSSATTLLNLIVSGQQ